MRDGLPASKTGRGPPAPSPPTPRRITGTPDLSWRPCIRQPPEEARRFGEIWGAPGIYPSLRSMLVEASLDVISICSPDSCHFSQAREILASPGRVKALLIEKPVCLTAVEFDCLMDLSRQSGVAVAVNHGRRFDAAHRQAAQLIRSGQLALAPGAGGLLWRLAA